MHIYTVQPACKQWANIHWQYAWLCTCKHHMYIYWFAYTYYSIYVFVYKSCSTVLSNSIYVTTCRPQAECEVSTFEVEACFEVLDILLTMLYSLDRISHAYLFKVFEVGKAKGKVHSWGCWCIKIALAILIELNVCTSIAKDYTHIIQRLHVGSPFQALTTCIIHGPL